jgi:predicted ATPase/DNA-binding SARP family transcriptional activator
VPQTLGLLAHRPTLVSTLVEVRLLGPLEVCLEDGPIDLGARKQRAVMAMLSLEAGRAVSADRLAEGLWGERQPSSAAKMVQQYVSQLRRLLGASGRIVTRGRGYELQLSDVDVDVRRAERLLEQSQPREALALWRGEPLSDLADEPFAASEIRRLEDLRLRATEMAIDADLAAGRHAELTGELDRLVAEHPLRERLHGQLMIALYRSGRQAEALEEYQRARELLVDQLGIEPGAELRELHQAILQQAADLPGSRQPVSRLPEPAGALFGRERDLAALVALVTGPETRLVTLVGPGGVGKTRLALEVADSVGEAFRDGAVWVELAPLGDPYDVPSAIGQALGALVDPREPPGTAVVRFLAARNVLLVLDNLEHLLPSADFVARVLDECRAVTVLATSREPTTLAGERRYPVAPLEVPDASAQLSDLDRLGGVAMFLDRVRARDPGFVLDEGSASHVAEICRRLDGLPLALELAAGRSELLGPAELAARLDGVLGLLVGGARDAPARHRTMRATIDWSFRALGAEERRAFARMALFRSGATVGAAEEVTGAPLEVLESLLAKHLIARRGDRLHMFEPVREFALEHLTEDPERDEAGERLARRCLAYAREATPHLVRAERIAWLRRLDAELPNTVAALSSCLDRGRAALALDLASAWGRYWWAANRGADGVPWIDRALGAARDATPRARAVALLERARLTTMRQAGYADDVRASLQLFRDCDDAAGIATCLALLAPLEAGALDHERARAMIQEAEQHAKRAGDETTLVTVLALGVSTAPTHAERTQRAEAAAAYARRVGDVHHLGIVCSVTGYKAIAEERYREALRWLDEGMQTVRVLGNARSVFYFAGNQGLARLFLDETDEAARAFREALAVCADAAAQDMVDEPLLGLAAVAARQGHPDRAARLAGAATAHRATFRIHEEELVSNRLIDGMLAPARDAFGPEQWDRLAQETASLSMDEAIALALSSDDRAAQSRS